jgi:hypothetical protein
MASATFGALQDNVSQMQEARHAGIPARLIRCGDSLEAALSRATTPAGLRPAA